MTDENSVYYDFVTRRDVAQEISGVENYDFGAGKSFERFCDFLYDRAHTNHQKSWVSKAEFEAALAEYKNN